MKARTTLAALSVTLIAVPVIFMTGCASQSASTYSRDQTQREMNVRMGVVESVRAVTIDGTKSPIGAGAGAIVGGIAGSTVGQGRGSDIGAVLGAVAGGVAGAAIENNATKQNGVEITIKLENGSYTAITQAADEVFKPGERVRILSGSGATRVTH
ncbi:MAG: glycine zipper 2TM domain-containing protein [Georgfuchsia sp.]